MQQLFETTVCLHLLNTYVLIIVKGWNLKNVFVTEAQPLNWAGLYKWVYCIQETLEITYLSCIRCKDGLWENCDTWSVRYLHPYMVGFMKNDKTKLFFLLNTIKYCGTGTEAEKQDKV